MRSAGDGRHEDGLTTGDRWRTRRNLVIFVAAEAGFSLRFLGDVYDLSRAQVRTIVEELRAKTSRERIDESPTIQAARGAFEVLKTSRGLSPYMGRRCTKTG